MFCVCRVRGGYSPKISAQVEFWMSGPMGGNGESAAGHGPTLPVTRGSLRRDFVLRYSGAEIHRSAEKHGVGPDAVRHAVDHAVVAVDLDTDADPPRVLAIGPAVAGNLIEVVWIELAADQDLVIRAMRLRPAFHGLLPGGDAM